MSPALESSVGIAAYLALFAAVGVVFLFANLLVGRFLRPDNPNPEKMEAYECGEPSIGSSFVQFDLRFYVVALLFIIFDVEVAFFFPWATVFGKSTTLMDEKFAVVATADSGEPVLTKPARQLYQELGVLDPQLPSSAAESGDSRTSSAERSEAIIRNGARQLAWFTLTDIVVFFGILLVGFGYVWIRGDLDWVRAVGQQRAARAEEVKSGVKQPPVLSA